MTKPWDLYEAEIVDGLARRYGIHPDLVEDGDVSILRRVNILDAASFHKPAE